MKRRLPSPGVGLALWQKLCMCLRQGAVRQQGSGKRGGVPQYIQPHALLVRGLLSMESLFPGFGKELVAAGGRPVDWLRDMLSVRLFLTLLYSEDMYVEDCRVCLKALKVFASCSLEKTTLHTKQGELRIL